MLPINTRVCEGDPNQIPIFIGVARFSVCNRLIQKLLPFLSFLASGGLPMTHAPFAACGTAKCRRKSSELIYIVAPSATLYSMVTAGGKSERVFKTAWFLKAAKKAYIADNELCAAIRQVILGQADDLGGGVFKKRLSRNQYRSIILAKGGQYWSTNICSPSKTGTISLTTS
jgi:RelE toxin of RelE / RelB toxin-antitoxin system